MAILKIDIGSLIIETFDELFNDIVNAEYDRIVAKGGRNSTKSSVIALAIILTVFYHKCDAVCLVKYNNKVTSRLVSTFLEMLVRCGLDGYFKYVGNRQELILLDSWHGKETKHSIKFTGVDDASKLKSFKPRSGTGGFRIVWFEELTDFFSLNEVNNVVNTMARGEGRHTVIMSYNPPRSKSNWVNEEYDAPCGKALGHDSNKYIEEYDISYSNHMGEKVYRKVRQLVHHSTYLDVIASGHPDWIGMTLINAETAKIHNDDQYRFEYLGEPIGTEGNIFNNIQILKDDEYDKSEIFRGLDFGFTNDPSAYVEWCYDKKNRVLYCHNEYVKKGADNATLKYSIGLFNTHNLRVWADCQEPRTINELNKLGMRVVGAEKGGDSIRHGIKWLQSLNAIYINPIKTPNIYREFTKYEYKINKQGEYTGELGDKDNHTIDATRYALWVAIQRSK